MSGPTGTSASPARRRLEADPRHLVRVRWLDEAVCPIRIEVQLLRRVRGGVRYFARFRGMLLGIAPRPATDPRAVMSRRGRSHRVARSAATLARNGSRSIREDIRDLLGSRAEGGYREEVIDDTAEVIMRRPRRGTAHALAPVPRVSRSGRRLPADGGAFASRCRRRRPPKLGPA